MLKGGEHETRYQEINGCNVYLENSGDPSVTPRKKQGRDLEIMLVGMDHINFQDFSFKN